jgi:glycosyltransferase involved in cell wall biosynthesis
MASNFQYLHFVQSLDPLHGGGLGTAAMGIHQALNLSGHSSHLLSTRASGFHSNFAEVTQFRRTGPTKLFYSARLQTQSGEWIDRAEVVHGHGFYTYPNYALGGQARKQGKPLVYHAHGMFDPWILRRSKLKKWMVHLLFENANFKHASFWRALSNKEATQIKKFGIKAPIEVIPNGVDIPSKREIKELVYYSSIFPKKRPRRIVFLSRIHPKKGLNLLIPAFKSLEKDLADWELAIFGPDEDGYRKIIEELVQEYELGEQVTFYGSVSGKEKEAAFRSGDLFVLPSYSEGFPMSILEAASFGLPVLQTSECNFPELARAGGAWMCEPNQESLIHSLREATNCDDQERHQRGEIGRKLVTANYSWKSIASRLNGACQTHC